MVERGAGGRIQRDCFSRMRIPIAGPASNAPALQIKPLSSVCQSRRNFQPVVFMTSSTVLTLTLGNFSSEVLQSSAPVLVHFWAEWCGPCKKIAPVLDELADQYEDRVKIGKVNIDEQPALAAEYDIRAVPTTLLLCQGQVADQIIGPLSKRDIEDSFDQVMA